MNLSHMNLSNMNLLQMSFTGGVLILAIILIRAVLINKLPKKTFLLLWGIVLLRLLIPFSIPSIFSAYSLLNQDMPGPEINTGTAATGLLSEAKNMAGGLVSTTETAAAGLPSIADMASAAENGLSDSVWFAIWFAGAFACAVFFTVTYICCRREFQTSLPVSNELTGRWLKEHQLKRSISIRRSDSIAAPLTYGIFHPVILMPQNTDWKNEQQLSYVLLHEYVHIHNYDAAIKWISILALCVHWFNPLVWAMYFLFNRDIELSCDEQVVRSFGESSKSAYARTLISMEEKKSRLTPLCNNFSKNAIEERITAIMKLKKTSLISILTAFILVISLTAVFATSAAAKTNYPASVPNTDFTEEEYARLLALRYKGYEAMTVAEFQKKVWHDTDTKEYMAVLEEFSQDEALYSLKDSNEISGFLFYTLEPLTAEKWQTRNYGDYVATSFSDAADNAALEYFINLTITDNTALTVKEYSIAVPGIKTALQNFLKEKTKEELQDEQGILDSLAIETDAFIKKYETDGLQITIDYTFLPLSPGNMEETLSQSAEETEPRQNPNGTEADYRSLLSLKTADYQTMTAADFNKALLAWANENFDSSERINEDVSRKDYGVSLTADEISFVSLTAYLSSVENAELVRSEYTGEPERDPAFAEMLPEKSDGLNGLSAWCDFYYQFSYHLTDKNAITVAERDRCVGGMLREVQRFWEETDLDELLKMDEAGVTARLKQTAEKYSNNLISITINEEQVQFEHMDERQSV